MEDRKDYSLVSIIVPCYNYGHLLSETLDSIQSQTYTKWECLVIDDGSSDNTSEIARSYQQKDCRFIYLYKKNGGVASARNFGLKHATGSWVQFLDADDLLTPDKIKLQLSFLEEHPHVNIVNVQPLYFTAAKPGKFYLRSSFKNKKWIPELKNVFGFYVLEYLLQKNILAVSAPLINKELIDGGLYFDETLRTMEDWDFWLRCALSGAVFSYLDIGENTTLIRVQPDSLSKDYVRMSNDELLIRQRIDQQLTDQNFSGILLPPNNIKHLKMINAINAYRAQMRMGDLKGYKDMIFRGKGIGVFSKMNYLIGDYLRYLKRKRFLSKNSAVGCSKI